MKDSINKELDQPILIGKKGGFFRGKDLRVIIVYEDGSAQEYFMRWPTRAILTIKNMSYFIVPKCVLRMKKSTLMYFYNNPMPIQLVYQSSKLTALSMYSDEQKNLMGADIETILAGVVIDSEMAHHGFENTFMRGLYNQGTTPLRTYLYIIGGVILAILILLQVTGKVDVIGNLTSAFSGGK